MDNRGQKKEQVGIVSSDKMDKTVVVKVERTYRHPFYGKILRTTKKFVAHDEKNECHVGDKVRIRESRPLSKTKKWRVAEVVERAQ